MVPTSVCSAAIEALEHFRSEFTCYCCRWVRLEQQIKHLLASSTVIDVKIKLTAVNVLVTRFEGTLFPPDQHVASEGLVLEYQRRQTEVTRVNIHVGGARS